MPTPTLEPRTSRDRRAVRERPGARRPGPAPRRPAAGTPSRAAKSANRKARRRASEGKTAGIRVVRPERRDIRMTVVQPGTIQAFEVTPIYSRISGYVEKYRYNIGDRVKAGDVLLDMWIPDLVEQHGQKSAAVKRAEVQIRVAESALRAAEAKLETAKARIVSAEAGVKRAQASYTRWESEYKRLETLVNQRVLDVQVRDETYRQFEEAAAARDQANAMVSEATSARDQAAADRDRARVDVEAARADLEVARADERRGPVMVEYGHIKAPYDGVITQRNVSPGDYLQPGGGTNGRPLFVLEQTDPVRVFVGVPELASYFIHDERHGPDPLPGDPGRHPRGQGRPLGLLAQPVHPHPPDRDRHPQRRRPPPPRLVRHRHHRDRPQAGLDPPLQRHRLPGAAELLRLPRGRRQAGPHPGHHRPVRRHAHRGPQEVRPRRQYQRLAGVRRHRARPRRQPRRPRRRAAGPGRRGRRLERLRPRWPRRRSVFSLSVLGNLDKPVN